METEQNFDKEEIEIITNKNNINPEKKTFSPFLPSSYVKCYSKTRFDVTTFDFTWEIEQFTSLLKIVDVIESPKFPETEKYKIEMRFSHEAESDKNEIKLYIRTQQQTLFDPCNQTNYNPNYKYNPNNRYDKYSERDSKPVTVQKTFHGFCTTTVMDSCKTVISSKSILGHIMDMTSLITISKSKLEFNHPNTLIIYCKFEIFVKPINNTIRLNLYPTALKDVKSHEDSTVESEKDEKSIKFILGEDQYVVSKKLLRATKSTYFTYLCRTHEGKEKNMTNDLITNNELQAFKQILFQLAQYQIKVIMICLKRY